LIDVRRALAARTQILGTFNHIKTIERWLTHFWP